MTEGDRTVSGRLRTRSSSPPDTGIHQCIDKIRELDASIALHEQRGKRLDPAAARSMTQCESLLAELLETLRRHDAEADGGTQEIDAAIEVR